LSTSVQIKILSNFEVMTLTSVFWQKKKKKSQIQSILINFFFHFLHHINSFFIIITIQIKKILKNNFLFFYKTILNIFLLYIISIDPFLLPHNHLSNTLRVPHTCNLSEHSIMWTMYAIQEFLCHMHLKLRSTWY